MSWIAVVGKGVWHVTEKIVGIEQNPEISSVVEGIPVAGPIINTIFGAIVHIEALIPHGNGQVKKAVVTAVVNNAHPAIAPDALGTAIDQTVAALNALEAALNPLSQSTNVGT